MSNKCNYPDGSYNDASAPWNLEDITETDAFADKRQELIDERVKDSCGWLVESFMDAQADILIGLSVLLSMPDNDDTDRNIGKYIRRMVVSYCTPPVDEIIEELEAENDI